MFLCPYENSWFRRCPAGAGADLSALGEAAAGAGCIWRRVPSPKRTEREDCTNTGYVFDRQGRELARHRKMHLFDIQVEGGQCFRESDTFSPGDTYTVFDTEFGRMGLCICFDIRFPELFSLMAGRRPFGVGSRRFQPDYRARPLGSGFRQRAVDGQCHGGGGSGQDPAAATFVAILWLSHPWGEVIRRFGTGERRSGGAGSPADGCRAGSASPCPPGARICTKRAENPLEKTPKPKASCLPHLRPAVRRYPRLELSQGSTPETLTFTATCWCWQ